MRKEATRKEEEPGQGSLLRFCFLVLHAEGVVNTVSGAILLFFPSWSLTKLGLSPILAAEPLAADIFRLFGVMCILIGCIGLTASVRRGSVEGLLLGDLTYLGVFYAWIEIVHFGSWTLESIGPSFLLIWFLAAVRTYWLVYADTPGMSAETRALKVWYGYAQTVWQLEGWVNLASALFIASMPDQFLTSLGIGDVSEHARWMLYWWASLLVIPGVMGLRTYISPDIQKCFLVGDFLCSFIFYRLISEYGGWTFGAISSMVTNLVFFPLFRVAFLVASSRQQSPPHLHQH
eukprot:CAMPEP_0177655748 /NCGR_PEP_ID=MMETSP0447-20121125/15153_1 /TAXON_ID=0 /ORGANISM="Stygamoeba regulata, Strain BSH-02190019" /LENGTH=289 /DNA_ID=CAMNT_0019159729 /DNA_START=39 /DNA_END=908 /DNA_ORIENTATION=+